MTAAEVGARAMVSQVCDFLVNHRIRLSVAICIVAVVIGLAGGRVPHIASVFENPLNVVGFVLMLCGLGLRSWAAGVLRKGKALTTTGPYSLCRHPLYLGTLLLLTGLLLIYPGLAIGVPTLGLVLAISWVTLRREERRMAGKYGTAWQRYAARTGRLLPRRLACDSSGEWSLAQWVRSREYNAVIAAAVALALLELWQGLVG